MHGTEKIQKSRQKEKGQILSKLGHSHFRSRTRMGTSAAERLSRSTDLPYASSFALFNHHVALHELFPECITSPVRYGADEALN